MTALRLPTRRLVSAARLVVTALIALFLGDSLPAGSVPLTLETPQTVLDGAVVSVPPGAVIRVAAGVRTGLLLANLHGTPDQPIIIINHGGKVRIGNTADAAALRIRDCTHLQVRGDGDPQHPYGIEVFRAEGGQGVQISGRSSDFELCHLEIHHAHYAGIMSKSDPTCGGELNRGRFTQRNVHIHHTYVHDVGGEGLYLGSSFYTGTTSQSCPGVVLYPHDIVGLRVHDVRTERTGREGIQVGCAVEACDIYRNEIRDAGIRGLEHQNSGLQINPGTTGRVFGNVIVGAPGNGITLTGLGDNTVFNNVVARVGGHGIFCDNRNRADDPSIGTRRGSSVVVLHNTLVHLGGFGLRSYNEYGPHFVHNNLVVDAASGLLHTPGVTLTASHNLLVPGVTEAGFVDPAHDDYRIQDTSPARHAGGDLGERTIPVDAGGLRRPLRGACDVGAHEAGPAPGQGLPAVRR